MIRYSAALNNRDVCFDEAEGLATVEEAMQFVEQHVGPHFSVNITAYYGDEITSDNIKFMGHFDYDPCHKTWSLDNPWMGWQHIRRELIPQFMQADDPWDLLKTISIK